MNWYISLLSGLIQGLTEFLPISSSGHLVIFHHFFNLPAEVQLEFDIFLHIGTLGSVLFVFHKDIIKLLTVNKKTLLLLIAATIPAVIAALFFDKKIESAFNSPKFVGFGLLITAVFLLIGSMAEKFRKIKKHNVTFPQAILIGISQALAILPGLSRSGLTISTALTGGIVKKEAVRFSFLMAIFAISGACVFKIHHLSTQILRNYFPDIAIGVVTSFVVGILAIKLVFKAISTRKWYIFSIYCALIGTIIVLYFDGVKP
ncbi:MAG: undecaprenyl-diphosphate phosphatase [Candidatus Omnitrophota bacterium]